MRGLMLSAWILLAHAGPAPAASLFAEARMRGPTVTVFVFSSDNQPTPGAAVTLTDGSGATLVHTQTDATGRCRFPTPAAGKYTLTAALPQGARTDHPLTIPSELALRSLRPQPEEIIVTGGPSREERVKLPWLRPALGLITLSVFLILVLYVVRRRSPAPGA